MRSDNLHNSRVNHVIMSFLIAFAVLLAPLLNFAQTQRRTPYLRTDDDGSETLCPLIPTLTLVLVEVEVRDKFGDYVPNLSHKDFIVHEDGQEQEVELCTEERVLDKETNRIKYTIGYWPPNIKEDRFRQISVGLRESKRDKWRVEYWPEGYFPIIRKQGSLTKACTGAREATGPLQFFLINCSP